MEKETDMNYVIVCTGCNGDGTYEDGPDCSRPASDCCGGCFKTKVCDDCSGSGELEVDYMDILSIISAKKIQIEIRSVIQKHKFGIQSLLSQLLDDEEQLKSFFGELITEALDEEV